MLEGYDSNSDSSCCDDLEPGVPILNTHNPYVKESEIKNINTSNSLNTFTPIRFDVNQNSIYIPDHNYNLARDLEERAAVIKCLCIIEAVTNVSYMIYGFYYPLLIFIISCCGYIGADTFDKKRIFYYLLYLYVQILCKLYILLYLITLAVNTKIRQRESDNFPNHMFLQNLKGPIVSSSILLATQLLITKFVIKFYKKIPETPVYDYIVL